MKGVGTIIRETLSCFAINDVGCGCTALANEMDAAGPDTVEQELQSYTEKMKESIKRWRRENNSIIPAPPEATIRLLIVYAISKSRSSLVLAEK